MMAVCEVQPPTSVATALTCMKSSSASVEGISSSATTTASSVRRRPRMLSPESATIRRRVTSSMSELRSRR